MDILNKHFLVYLVLSQYCHYVLPSSFVSSKLCNKYSDSNLVGKLTNLNEIIPKPINCPLDCITYIHSTSALGYNGPLGALGPLSQFGPASVVKKSSFNLLINHKENPLSSIGPLGDSFWDVMPKINDFTSHMQGLGLWSILGPLGPLGALGPLGPLGPHGIHGFRINENGEYVNETGQIQNSVSVFFNDTMNITWPLYEHYINNSYFLSLSKRKELDTSFMVRSETDVNGDEFYMKVTEPQFISILVAPVVWAKNFFIEVYLNNLFIMKSTSSSLHTPWVQVHVSEKDLVKNLELKVIVKSDPLNCGLLSLLRCSMPYYFHVIGSTSFMLRRPHIEYSGPYIKDCPNK